MKHLMVSIGVLFLAAMPGCGQSLDDLNIQIHGYATQGFLYTTQNNILTTNSSDGSPAWSEAVVNVGAQPIPKLRIAVQGRFFLLGDYGREITLDWAAGDYKVNDKFGVRFGKVKTPSGLFNEIQDIDPGYLWSLLPQSIYPIASRDSLLAHFGGVVYGTLPLGAGAGKLEYRGWGGERVIAANDGYWTSFREEGINLTNGLDGVTDGAALHWRTPLEGLMVGASLSHSNRWAGTLTDTYVVPAGPSKGVTITTPGSLVLDPINQQNYFVRFERNRFMAAGEVNRTQGDLMLNGVSPYPEFFDQHSWYAMSSYKVTSKLIAGAYDTQDFDHRVALGPIRYFKDWTFSGRYDFNQFVYAKAEQHFIEGTMLDYDAALNPGGLQPSTKLTILKVGVSF